MGQEVWWSEKKERKKGIAVLQRGKIDEGGATGW